MTPVERLQAAIEKANNMVISSSLAIMDRDSSVTERAQARYFQSLFSAIRNVMSDALADAEGSHDEPGAFDGAVALATAVLGEQETTR